MRDLTTGRGGAAQMILLGLGAGFVLLLLVYLAARDNPNW